MDTSAADAELIDIQNEFFGGQYDDVAKRDLNIFSDSAKRQARIYMLRAEIALGRSRDVVTKLSKENSPSLQAVRALAEYNSGKKPSAINTVEKLVADADASEDENVQILGAVVLQNEKRTEEAVALLEKHSGSLEAIALLIQLQLCQNRVDLALKEVAVARRTGHDDMLINLAESWVGMRVGGDDYQRAYYVFDELANTEATSAPLSLASVAVSEIHQERFEEAEAALTTAVNDHYQHEDVLANLHVVSILMNKKNDTWLSTLSEMNDTHALVTGLNEKSDLFDTAAAKFTAAV